MSPNWRVAQTDRSKTVLENLVAMTSISRLQPAKGAQAHYDFSDRDVFRYHRTLGVNTEHRALVLRIPVVKPSDVPFRERLKMG